MIWLDNFFFCNLHLWNYLELMMMISLCKIGIFLHLSCLVLFDLCVCLGKLNEMKKKLNLGQIKCGQFIHSVFEDITRKKNMFHHHQKINIQKSWWISVMMNVNKESTTYVKQIHISDGLIFDISTEFFFFDTRRIGGRKTHQLNINISRMLLLVFVSHNKIWKEIPQKKNPDVFTVLAQCQNQPNEATTETKYEMWQDYRKEKMRRRLIL